MAYLAQPTSKTDYGVVGIGSFIDVLEGIISLEQDVSPNASVSFNQVSIGGSDVVTSVNPIAGTGISITNLVSIGNTVGFAVSNTGVLSVTAGDGITLSGSTGNITISAFGADLIETIGVTGSYTATANDEYIGVFSAAAVTITLPIGVTGRVYIIKDEYGQGSGKITIKPSGTEQIDNKADYIISVPNQSVSVVFRGGQWRII
jgi:hypothetical protein